LTGAAIGGLAAAGSSSTTTALVGGLGAAAGDLVSQGIAIHEGWQQGGYDFSQTIGAFVGGFLFAPLIHESGYELFCTQSGKTVGDYLAFAIVGAGSAALGNAATQGLQIASGSRAEFDLQDFLFAALNGAINGLATLKTRPCFVAGTPLRTPEGDQPIEQFRAGDLVLSAPEDDPNGPVRPHLVEQVFRSQSPILELQVGGRTIRTTAEHPFWVIDRGWVRAGDLSAGDLLRGLDGRSVAVTGTVDTGESAAVFNLRVAEDHTYFVGSLEWGFSIWSHNACNVNEDRGTGPKKYSEEVLRLVAAAYEFRAARGTVDEVSWNNMADYIEGQLAKDPQEGNWKAYYEKLSGVPFPSNTMDRPHSHHGIFKEGTAAMQETIAFAHDLVWNAGIDPAYNLRNLGWAPNRGPANHSPENLLDSTMYLHLASLTEAEPNIRRTGKVQDNGVVSVADALTDIQAWYQSGNQRTRGQASPYGQDTPNWTQKMNDAALGLLGAQETWGTKGEVSLTEALSHLFPTARRPQSK
jgi:hypothetical protein